MKGKIICLVGSPACGKTFLAKKLAFNLKSILTTLTITIFRINPISPFFDKITYRRSLENLILAH